MELDEECCRKESRTLDPTTAQMLRTRRLCRLRRSAGWWQCESLTLQQWLLEQREGNRSRIYVVHRLDLGTSGVLVFAKTPHANRVLSDRFRAHDLEREYLCIVEGVFPDGVTRLDTPIAGKVAVTHVRVEEHLGARATYLRCRLETGRTHQIRIHCAGAGHPLAGDVAHGSRLIAAPRPALHATRLAFPHPRTRELLSFERPWPAELNALLSRLRSEPAPQ